MLLSARQGGDGFSPHLPSLFATLPCLDCKRENKVRYHKKHKTTDILWLIAFGIFVGFEILLWLVVPFIVGK